MAETLWRKIALQSWRSIETSRIYAFVDLPIQETDRALTARVCSAAAKSVEAFPELKAWVHRSKVVRLDDADAFLQVETERGGLWSIWLRKAHLRSTAELNQEIKDKADRARNTVSPMKKKFQTWGAILPGFILRWGMNAWTCMRAYGLGRKDAFGTFAVSNAGRGSGPPRIPAPNRYTPWSLQIVLGEKIQKPMVVDGQIRAQWVLPCSVSIDHRLMDGAQAGRWIHHFVSSFKNA